jgi:hypothetical protein
MEWNKETDKLFFTVIRDGIKEGYYKRRTVVRRAQLSLLYMINSC